MSGGDRQHPNVTNASNTWLQSFPANVIQRKIMIRIKNIKADKVWNDEFLKIQYFMHKNCEKQLEYLREPHNQLLIHSPAGIHSFTS